MPDTSTIILIIIVAVIFIAPVVIWPVRWILNAKAYEKFIGEAGELHALAFAGKTEDIRRDARARFKALVERAVKSRNFYINNRDVAELLQSHVDSVIEGAAADRQADEQEARSWGEQMKELIQPMLQNPRNRERKELNEYA
jgi:hypothetical protein